MQSIFRRDYLNFKPCDTNTCPKDQRCFQWKTERKETYCVLSKPTASKGKCVADYGCVKNNRGLVCWEGKCYPLPPTQKVNEFCDITHTCETGLGCYGTRCKKPLGSKCSARSECVPSHPCVNGVCARAQVGDTCDAQQLDDCVTLSYCSKATGKCKEQSGRGGPCVEGDGKACGKGTKCFQGICQLRSYKDACSEAGTPCLGGLICSAQKVCEYRLPAGAACQASSDCEFGICYQGKCQELKAPGTNCSKDSDCNVGEECTRKGRCCPRGKSDC